MSSTVVLRVDNLAKNFGGLKVLRDVSFELGRGSVTGILGRNGAGKTTMFNLLCRILPWSGGEVFFEGTSLDGLRPFEVASLGISRSFQVLALSPEVSVRRNLELGFIQPSKLGLGETILRTPSAHRKRAVIERRIDEVIELMPFLGEVADERLGDLSLGIQRCVDIARAVMAKPRLLLLDEPTAGMTRPEKIRIESLIQVLRQAGTTILIVDHDMDFIQATTDYYLFLHEGKIISSGKSSEITNVDIIREAYLS